MELYFGRLLHLWTENANLHFAVDLVIVQLGPQVEALQ